MTSSEKIEIEIKNQERLLEINRDDLKEVNDEMKEVSKKLKQIQEFYNNQKIKYVAANKIVSSIKESQKAITERNKKILNKLLDLNKEIQNKNKISEDIKETFLEIKNLIIDNHLDSNPVFKQLENALMHTEINEINHKEAIEITLLHSLSQEEKANIKKLQSDLNLLSNYLGMNFKTIRTEFENVSKRVENVDNLLKKLFNFYTIGEKYNNLQTAIRNFSVALPNMNVEVKGLFGIKKKGIKLEMKWPKIRDEINTYLKDLASKIKNPFYNQGFISSSKITKKSIKKNIDLINEEVEKSEAKMKEEYAKITSSYKKIMDQQIELAKKLSALQAQKETILEDMKKQEEKIEELDHNHIYHTVLETGPGGSWTNNRENRSRSRKLLK